LGKKSTKPAPSLAHPPAHPQSRVRIRNGTPTPPQKTTPATTPAITTIATKSTPITNTAIKNAKPADKPYRLSAGRGLVLLVHPNGSKYWQYRYRRFGTEQLISLGVWGTTRDLVSLENAFAAREEIRAKVREGIDPAQEKRDQKKEQQQRLSSLAQKARDATTFKKVGLDWLSVWSRGKTTRTVGYQARRLENDIFPVIGAMPIELVGRRDVIEVVRMIDARGAHEMASRALNVISRILGYAVTHELRESNPAFDIKPADIIGTVAVKNFASISPKELPALLQKIKVYDGVLTRLAIELLALTFVRTNELIGAQWSEIDFLAQRWTIPGARMKKTKGAQVPHIVPLATQTLALLQALKTLSGGKTFLFPGSGSEKPMSNGTILVALKRMGYQGRMTGHGFRSIASTVLHEQGFNHLYIERQLAHMERDEVSAAYNYAEYLEQRAPMMQWWADYLDRSRAASENGKVTNERKA